MSDGDGDGARARAASQTIAWLAALCGFSGVALGAFGAHALRARLPPELLEVYRTGVLYQLVHAAALVGLAAAPERFGRPRLTASLFAVGVLLFSGSLYILAVTGVRALGAVTPLGGVAFIAGWLSLLLWRRPANAGAGTPGGGSPR